MLKNIISRIKNKVYKYWCPFCELRFKDKDAFEKHYLEDRVKYLEKKNKQIPKKVLVERARRLKAKRKQGRR